MNDDKLTLEELNYVQDEVKLKQKNTLVAYLLAVFLGPLGLHRVYFDKYKSATVRFLLTSGIIGTFIKIYITMSNIDLNKKLMREVMTYNAILATGFFVLLAISLVWTIIDLFLIYRWIEDINDKNREEAKEEVIKARYVSEQQLKEDISEHLLKELKKIKAEVKAETIEEIDGMISNLELDSKNNNSKHIDKQDKTEDIENVKMPTLPNPGKKNVDLNQLAKKDEEDFIGYEGHYIESKEQVDIDKIKPDEIEEEFEDEITPIPEPMQEIVNNEDSPDITSEKKTYYSELIEDHKEEEDNTVNPEDNTVNPEDNVHTTDKDNKEESNKDNKEEKENNKYLSINEAIENNSGNHMVQGYILGAAKNNEIQSEDITENSNLVLTEDINTQENLLYVQLPNNRIRKRFNLKDNPDNIYKKVEIQGELDSYFGKPGLRKLTYINFV